MMMSPFERTHEFGMLLSLGCGPGRLSRIIAAEAVILGFLDVATSETVKGFGEDLSARSRGKRADLRLKSLDSEYGGTPVSGLVQIRFYY